MIESETRLAPCNRCLHHTRHAVLFTRTVPWEEVVDAQYGATIYGSNTYSLLECAGCGDVRFVHDHWFSEDFDEAGPAKHADFYPPVATRQRPTWHVLGLPLYLSTGTVGQLLDEIYCALPIKAYRIAVMGIRSLVEHIMIDRVGDKGTFEKNIQAFFTTGHVAPIQQPIFRDALIEAGHAAMHRDWAPTEDDVTTLLDIVEGIIKAIYVEPAKAARVEKRLPPRT